MNLTKFISIPKPITKLRSRSLQIKTLSLSLPLSLQHNLIERELFSQEKMLIKGYFTKYLQVFNKIRMLVLGKHASLNLSQKDYQIYKLDSKVILKEPIKQFWKTILINCKFFFINENDKIILSYLKDVVIIPNEKNFPDFVIEFHFGENRFFANKVLSKEFLYCFNSVDKVKEIKCSLIEWKSIDSGFDKTQKSFFNFFSIYEKDKSIPGTNGKKLISCEAKFIKNDLMKNLLEYYLNIMSIKFDD
jgi:hypothetical protein